MTESKTSLQEGKGIKIIRAESRKHIKEFVEFQYRLYCNEKNFVPPLKGDMYKTIKGIGNPLFGNGEYARFIAVKNGRTCGRIIAGIDQDLNRRKGSSKGYITLFECIDDYDAAKALFDASVIWLKEHNVNYFKGPVSPTGGDDFRGLLIDAFDSPPVLMNSYNLSYYRDFFEKYGFIKDIDLYAYHFDLKDVRGLQRKKVVDYTMKRYDFTVDSIDLDNIEREINDIKKVIDIAMPDEWPDLVPPSLDSIREFAQKFRKLAAPDLVLIARSKGEPVGFSLAMPNYNEIFIKLKGRLFPFGILRLLTGKKKIKSARSFVLFVAPEFRKKGVSGAMFYKSFENSVKRGYTWGEGSTIGDVNLHMRRDAEGAGGVHYKTYRMYGMNI